MDIKIAPSILSADFSKLGEEIKTAELAGADMIHIDVMDGHYVPNITIGPLVVAAIRPITSLELDVHLMIETPEKYIASFVEAGADIITVHVEACKHIHRTVQQIKDLGVKVGVSLNPGTSLSVLDYILQDIDMVLIMSVNPGFGGQSFIQSSVNKIRILREKTKTSNMHLDIQVDGGINEKTAKLVTSAGANILVAGSYLFGNKDMKHRMELLRG